jgi:hypothetical protein
MRLCIGVFATILHHCLYNDKQNQHELIRILMQIVDKDTDTSAQKYSCLFDDDAARKFIVRLYRCENNPGKMKNSDYGHIITVARSATLAETSKRLVERLINQNLIDVGKKKLLVTALREVVRNDDGIRNGDSALFVERVGATVDEFLTGNVVLSSFLASTLLFAFAVGENKIGRCTATCGKSKEACKPNPCKSDCVIRIDEFMKRCTQINDSFIITSEISQMIESTDDISSDESTPILPKTIVDDTFDSVFSEVGSSINLSLPNASNLRTFRLDVENSAFVYGNLQEYLVDHIGQYIYSRAKIDLFEASGKAYSIVYKAVEQLKKVYKFEKNNIGDELGDILLYFLLEEKLLAPKLFSKIELAQNGCSVANSYGVHLLPLSNLSFQMVYGKSRIDGDIKNAIDNAFEYIERVRADNFSNYNIVESGILERSFDKATTDTLKSILVPKKAATVSMNKAFGVFLGYSLGVETDTLSCDEAHDAIISKMENDIETHKQYIVDKITSANPTLTPYSFYIYVLPFNNADEKTAIMNTLLGREQ